MGRRQNSGFDPLCNLLQRFYFTHYTFTATNFKKYRAKWHEKNIRPMMQQKVVLRRITLYLLKRVTTQNNKYGNFSKFIISIHVGGVDNKMPQLQAMQSELLD